jgi:hypothetical protein
MAVNADRIGPDIPSTRAVEDGAARSVLEALRIRVDMAARRHPGTAPFEDVPATATLPELIAAFNAFVRSQQL